MPAFLKRLFRRKPKPEYPRCFLHDTAIIEDNLTTGESKKLCRGIMFGWKCKRCPHYIVNNFIKQTLRRKP